MVKDRPTVLVVGLLVHIGSNLDVKVGLRTDCPGIVHHSQGVSSKGIDVAYHEPFVANIDSTLHRRERIRSNHSTFDVAVRIAVAEGLIGFSIDDLDGYDHGGRLLWVKAHCISTTSIDAEELPPPISIPAVLNVNASDAHAIESIYFVRVDPVDVVADCVEFTPRFAQ